MANKKGIQRDPNRLPLHPGEVYRTVSIPALKRSMLDIANDLRISRQHLHALINGKKDFSTDMALRFARYFGGSATTILKLQIDYDLFHSKNKSDLEKIPEYKSERPSA